MPLDDSSPSSGKDAYPAHSLSNLAVRSNTIKDQATMTQLNSCPNHAWAVLVVTISLPDAYRLHRDFTALACGLGFLSVVFEGGWWSGTPHLSISQPLLFLFFLLFGGRVTNRNNVFMARPVLTLEAAPPRWQTARRACSTAPTAR